MNTQLNSFVVADPQKCIGCRLCEVSCSVTHTEAVAKTAGMLETPIIPRLYLVKTAELTMPVQCRHCEDAPCANVCPVNAINQRNQVIFIDEEICIGCKTCLVACPFGAIEMAPRYRDGKQLLQKGLMSETEYGLQAKVAMTASKCDLCIDRADGLACVKACPEKALEFIMPAVLKKNRNLRAALNVTVSVKKFIE